MSEFKGKTVVITGGNSGMGFATAKRFHDLGANIVITGRNQERLNASQQELGENCIAIQADVSKISDIEGLVQKTKERFGQVDVLFANAGLGDLAPLAQTSEELYDSMMQTNVKGVYFTVQKFLPILKDGASIILNSSVVNNKGMENFSVYNATKAAVRSFARSFTSDLKDRKIRVNSVSPGPIETPFFTKTSLTEEQIQGMAQGLAQAVPLGRFGYSDEIADAVVWLASNQSSYVTGIDLPVDGGFTQV